MVCHDISQAQCSRSISIHLFLRVLRSSFFLIGWYSFALICLALILKFGVLQAVNPPSDAIRGVFVLACSIAGIAGGGVAIFFWQQAKVGDLLDRLSNILISALF